jgi:hypothetical protein
MSRFHRWILKTARTIHVYVTLLGLTLILFFAITGFMLNHIEWFMLDKPRVRAEERALPTAKLVGGKLPAPGEAKAEDKFAIVEALRKEFGIAGEMTSFDNGDDEKIVVNFKRAGEETEAEVRRADANTKVEQRHQGWAMVITDLHRGNRGNVEKETKFTGRVWSVVIDATCVLLLIISTTGLILWWSLKSRGKWGAILLLTGGASAFAVYYWFVP